MDTVKKAQAKFKACTLVIEFATALVNKSIALVNDKILNDVKFVNRQIESKNVSKLKTPVLVTPLQHYMTLTSSLNLLISYGQNATYDRKLVIRTLKRHVELKTKDDGTRADYIEKKLNLMVERIESSIAQLETIITTVKFFSTYGFIGGDADDADDAPDTPNNVKVTSLADVAKHLSGMKSKIESTFSEVKAVMKPVRELFSKKGSYEAMLVQDFEALMDTIQDRRVSGGVENECDLETVKIGGDVYYGGYKCDQDLDIKMTWAECCRGGDFDDESLEMVNNKLFRIFGGSSKKDLEAFVNLPTVGMFEKFSSDMELGKTLTDQLDYAMEKLPQFEQYYYNHRDQYVMEDVTDEPELPEEPASNSNEDRLAYVCEYIRTIIGALDEVDRRVLHLQAKKELERVDEDLSRAEGGSSISDEADQLYQKSLDLCTKPILNRKSTKKEILEHLDNAENENTVMILPRHAPKPKNASVIGMADYLIEQQMHMSPGLESAEKTYMERANELGKALETVDYLMSPDEKDPCVCKAIGAMKCILTADLLTKLGKGEASEKIAKSKEMMLAKLGIDDMKLYTNKVQTKEIDHLADEIVVAL